MYVALSKLALGTHLGGKREKKPPQNPKQEPNPRILSDDLSKVNIYEVVTAWEESMLFQYHKQCHCFHSVFLEFHTSESANNFTKAANVPGTCPDHVSHIHCLEGSKLTLKNNFLNIILLFSHCLESSIVELQHGEKSTNLC